MFKKKYYSVHGDFKTGILCKFTLFIGILLLLISLFFIIASVLIGDESSGILRQIYNFSQTTIPTSLLSFSLIFIAVGVILYFFHCQFAKLEKIADEIEKDENLEDVSEN